MKRFNLLLAILSLCIGYASAGGAGSTGAFVLYQNFQITDSYTSNPFDPSKYAELEGWDFTNAFEGPGCVIIKKGGTMTTPCVPELIGNATLNFDIAPWEDPSSSKTEEWLTPHTLSVVNGELNTTELDETVSMSYHYVYNANADTRITLTAGHDIFIRRFSIYYPDPYENSGMGSVSENYTQYSHLGGDYYEPFDLTMKVSSSKMNFGDDGTHNILVYTLDGSNPIRSSAQYDGSPIHIDKTTTLKAATIFGDGSIIADKPQTYVLAIAETPEIPKATFSVNVQTPGTLRDLLMAIDADEIEGLTLTGKINGDDLACLVATKGPAADLKYLDMGDVTFDYDNGLYKTEVYAPEGGMGTTSTYYYYLSEENKTEGGSSSPTTATIHCYSNNLAAAFGSKPIERIVAPKVLTSIGDRAFSQAIMVTLPHNLTEIGRNALSNCSNVNLPTTLKKIEAYAFGSNLIMDYVDLPALEYIGEGAFSGTKINRFNFNAPISYIGEKAFASSILKEAIITHAPDTLPADIFRYCGSLRKVVVEAPVKAIGDYAFADCNALTELSLPESIEMIGEEAIPDKLLPEAEDGIHYVGKVAYKRVGNEAEYTVKEGTVALGARLFNSSFVNKVTLPRSLKIIGPYAFAGSTMKSTPDMSGVVRIDDNAFEYCSNLAKITIPESLESIGFNIFQGCNALWSVEYNAIDLKEGVIWNTRSGWNPNPFEYVKIGEKVSHLPAGLYDWNKTITEVTLPESVETIGEGAFKDCSSLERLIATGTLKEIRSNAFGDCISLTELPMLDVEKIWDRAFYHCEKLQTVNLSDRVKEIGSQAFDRCSSLSAIHWPAYLEEIGDNAFGSCSSLETISLPEGMKKVGNSAFSSCSSIKKVYIPSTLEVSEEMYQAFKFLNEGAESVITCMLPEPPATEKLGWAWKWNNRVGRVKVPAAYIDAYRAHPEWKDLADKLETVEGISTSDKTTETSFASGINADMDLTDSVVDNLYLTLGEDDEYDEEDGALVLNSTMDEDDLEVVSTLAPGESDIANRFNGIVVKLAAGKGSLKINCQTLGNRKLSVMIGNEDPVSFAQDSKGDITLEYDVAEDTYAYIYASDTSNKQGVARRIATRASDGNVRIYSVAVSPETQGVDGIIDMDSEIVTFHNLDGLHIERPTNAGIYIVRKADGTTAKIMIK